MEKISKKKQKLIDEFKLSPFKKGEVVAIYENIFDGLIKYNSNPKKTMYVTIIEIKNDDTLIVKDNRYGYGNEIREISKNDVVDRYNVINVGANPFNEKGGDIRPIAYGLDSIIFMFEFTEQKFNPSDGYIFDGVKCHEVNWNPFVYDKNGKKQYYQRDFCWKLKDKQLLIDSIYNGINLGTILVRKRGWNEIEKMRANGETELAFKDIVDGKQRLNAIKEFINNEFKDSYGNYFSDLSFYAQNKFTNNQLLQYAEMNENTKDEDVIYQFLKLNFSGIPQSKEHINFVKDILKIM